MGYLGRRCYRQGSSSVTTVAPSLSHTHSVPFVHTLSLSLSLSPMHAQTLPLSRSLSHLRSVGRVEGNGGVGVVGGFNSAQLG